MADVQNTDAAEVEIPSVKQIDIPEKRKRGRPPGSGKTSVPLQAENGGTSSKAGSAPDRSGEAAIIGNCGVMLWQLTENILHSSLEKKLRDTPEAKSAFNDVAAKCVLTTGEAQMIRESLTKIAARYSITTKYAPEVALGMVLISYSVRQMELINFVKEIRALKDSDEKRTESKS